MSKSKINISYNEVVSVLTTILKRNGIVEEQAVLLAELFTENSFQGKDSHGLNRFPGFIRSLNRGVINIKAHPYITKSFHSFEQWNGDFGIGPINAITFTDRAMELADEYGIGCVALKNTNHWMRGGSYGLRAAKRGYLFMAFSNTKPNMPVWGSDDLKLGNNPMVIAIPKKNNPVVLDMAMSQFSYGKMEVLSRNKKMLPVSGGYDKSGQLTSDPTEILETGRLLPMGLWKGSGLALVLDLMATLLSGGMATKEIGKKEHETGLSQVFIAVNRKYLQEDGEAERIVNEIVADYKSSKSLKDMKVHYPGEGIEEKFEENLVTGIDVADNLWKEIKDFIK